MIQSRRLGHVTLETPDLDKMVDYYENVLGLRVLSRDPKNIYFGTRVGQLAVHIQNGPVSLCSRLSFEVAPTTEFDEIQTNLVDDGVGAEIRSDVAPGVGKVLSIVDPTGTAIDLFSSWEFMPRAGTNGAAPLKLGHVASVVDDPKEVASFYSKNLGFRVSDWVEEFFVFMRCGPDHHTVNFLQGAGSRTHHIAFEMRDTAHLTESCDVLGQHKIPIIWGPVRHGPGHNVATYHVSPDGLIVELFSELDRMVDEDLGYFDPRPWHEDRPQRPKVWGGKERRDVWGPPIPSNFLQPADALVR